VSAITARISLPGPERQRGQRSDRGDDDVARQTPGAEGADLDCLDDEQVGAEREAAERRCKDRGT
jgi:hypothetical protein